MHIFRASKPSSNHLVSLCWVDGRVGLSTWRLVLIAGYAWTVHTVIVLMITALVLLELLCHRRSGDFSQGLKERQHVNIYTYVILSRILNTLTNSPGFLIFRPRSLREAQYSHKESMVSNRSSRLSQRVQGFSQRLNTLTDSPRSHTENEEFIPEAQNSHR